MSFLRNAWYAAGWSHEITRAPLPRTLLGEKLVFYRKEADGIIAISDVCPHRFAPMHGGKLHGDALACPYHGLQFGEGGNCVHNPHSNQASDYLSMKGYKVAERDGTVWIWMGESELSDESKIPDFPAHSDQKFRSVYGYLPVGGNYQLVTDNLLDLSHTQFLHSFLTVDGKDTEVQFDVTVTGGMVTTMNNYLNQTKGGFTAFVWPDGPEKIDNYGGLRWQAPANMLLKVYLTQHGRSEEEGVHAWSAHLVTPETETKCHYFWSFARDFRLDDEEFSTALQYAIGEIFRTEDGAIIAKVQENMGEETDLLALRPAILPTDKAAILVRRTLGKMIRQESAGATGAVAAE